jgi:CubicO group peptidase (beta-lactamase class C family)
LSLIGAAPLLLRAYPLAAAATPRRWLITGEPDRRLEALDAAMQLFMQRHAIRSGTLALARDGRTLFEHAYTWAEADYPVVQPDSPFRLASVSKALTAALVHELVQTRKVDLDVPVFPLLGLDRPARVGQQVDPRLSTITVRHLLDHHGGFGAFDPVFRMRDVARRLGLHVAPTAHDLARYMVGEPLQAAPGTQSHYSNFGYLILGLVAAKLTHTDYPAAGHTRGGAARHRARSSRAHP